MTDKPATELLPCPFCGEQAAKTVYVRDGRMVACRCGASGPAQFHGPNNLPSADERAKAAWNSRIRAETAKNSGGPDRDMFGRLVREAWVRWAETQPSPKSTWLVPYDELSEPDKEADRQIGEAMFRWSKAYLESANALTPSIPVAYDRKDALNKLKNNDTGGFEGVQTLLSLYPSKYNTEPLYLATPANSRAEAIGVKPLEWGEVRETDDYGVLVQDAECSIGRYIASDAGWFLLGLGGWHPLTDREAAKAAAQANFEQRIRSALLQQEGE